MELDELKYAWNTLEHRLKAQTELSAQLLKEHGAQRAKSQLRPLFWGQWAQILLGIASAGIGARFWLSHLSEPALLATGAIVHLYGVALIVLAVRLLMMLRGLALSAPVMDIQKQLANIERVHVQNGLIVGLPWWVLWIPYSLIFLVMADVQAPLAPENQAWIWISLALCLVGMGLTAGLVALARRGKSPSAQRQNKMIIGASLVRAQGELSKIKHFEQEA